MTEDDVRRIVREELEAQRLAKFVHVQWPGETSWTFHQGCECGQCQIAYTRIVDSQNWRRTSEGVPW
jgi:hypothetical protein